MISIILKSIAKAFGITTVMFTFIPETFFRKVEWLSQVNIEECKWLTESDIPYINILISRFLFLCAILIITIFLYQVFLKYRVWITIKGQNYSVKVEYGNIFKTKNCKRVINFDECFTTQVGNATADINPNSICGQYLALHPTLDVQKLIDKAQIKPARTKSKYEKAMRYDSGTIVPNGDDLLMAFAQLDEKGKARFFSRDEYLECLDLLWRELENHYSEKDVCIPILGAGTTSFDGGAGASISQQDLLDMMIWSYKLSSHKIKSPHKLRIVCKRNSDFSINNIDR